MFYTIVGKKLFNYSDNEYPNAQYTDIITEQEYRQHPNKVMVQENQEEIEVPECDENGNIIGHHKEIIFSYELVLNPNYEAEETARLKSELHTENTIKAKQAVEQGYVEFNDAKFETNSQTVSDLTSAMLIMKESEMSVYPWLSMDDKYIELTLEDFGTLGSLIAGFKAQVWNTKYIGYKTQIALAQTIEELKAIEIEY